MRSPLHRIITPCAPAALLAIVVVLVSGCASPHSARHSLRESLTFHASFDHGADADYARGDRQIYHAKGMNERFAGTPGLPTTPEVQLAEKAGRFGHGLRFLQAKAPVIFYHSPSNVEFHSNQWSGTVSFWLSTDPATQLAPGYCDPIQITSKAWNDAAFFTEFEKKTNGIPFRLGVYADLKVWNPNDRDWNKMAPHEKPLLTIDHPPFSAGKWTHVVFTFENFNTGKPDGVAKLYLDGEFRGAIPARTQTFNWDPAKSLIMLGIGYVGLYDDVSIYNRALSPQEIITLRDLPNGVSDLVR
jgi:hypothetical protein